MHGFNPSYAEVTFFQKHKDAKIFENHRNPVGIHWKALTEYSQMSTHALGFQSVLSFFA